MTSFCTACGTPLMDETARFCLQCGASVVASEKPSIAPPAPGVSRKGWRTRNVVILVIAIFAFVVIWAIVEGNQNETASSQKKVESQSGAAEPAVPAGEKQPTVAGETLPTMFEWRGVHDGMTLAEFQAKYPSMFCGEGKFGPGEYGPVCEQSRDTSKPEENADVSFFQGQLFAFGAYCDFGSACETSVFAAMKAHFGKPIYDKYDNAAGHLWWHTVGWESPLEFVEYKAPHDASGPTPELNVCSFALSPSGTPCGHGKN